MSTALVKSEIQRFLKSTSPEVLCIRGKWGVGKTFAWMQFVRGAALEKSFGLKTYSYVSLFGINSLESLKYAIFENSVTESQVGPGPNLNTFKDMLESVGTLGRKVKPIFDSVLGFAGRSNAGEALARATFLSVREKIICLDDLERAGNNLDIKDVLGLASMLKEQRKCKVVLLLNDQQLEKDEKEDFDRLLEKAVDVSLMFAPTPQEAVDLAIQDETEVNRLLRQHITSLEINNIRIIKKIERLAIRLAELVEGYHEQVLAQAVSTAVIAGYCVFDTTSKVVPTLDFLRKHNRDLEIMKAQKDEDSPKKAWSELLNSYGYRFSDEFDLLIIDGFDHGYFDDEAIKTAATNLQINIENNKLNNSYTKAWEAYHHSLTIDDREVLDGIFQGALENVSVISPMNINGTAKFLRDAGRSKEADQLVDAYFENRNFKPGEIEEEFRLWGKEPLDPKFSEATDEINSSFVDNRDPKDVLLNMARNSGWNPEDIDLLATQTPEKFEEIFESITGLDLPRTAKFAVSLGKHNGENHKKLGENLDAGLKRIAAKSFLKAKRVKSFGIELK